MWRYETKTNRSVSNPCQRLIFECYNNTTEQNNTSEQYNVIQTIQHYTEQYNTTKTKQYY